MAKSKPIGPVDEFHSVSVREIDNGYIVSRSSSGPKGYKCTETFSAQKPKIEMGTLASKAAPKPAARPTQKEPMKPVAKAGGSVKGKK